MILYSRRNQDKKTIVPSLKNVSTILLYTALFLALILTASELNIGNNIK